MYQRAVIQTLMGKDPCCIPSVWVLVSHFQGSNGNNGQEPPSSSGYPRIQQNWADTLKGQNRSVWVLHSFGIYLAMWSLATHFFSFFFKKLNSVVLNPGCVTNRIVWKPSIHTGTQVPSWSNDIRSITVKKSPFPQVKVGGVGPICSHSHTATEEIWPFLYSQAT